MQAFNIYELQTYWHSAEVCMLIKILSPSCRACALPMAQFLGGRIQQLAIVSSHAESAATVDSYDAQDAVSCLYHILQLHGSYLANEWGRPGLAVIVQCAEAMLSALRVSVLLSSEKPVCYELLLLLHLLLLLFVSL